MTTKTPTKHRTGADNKTGTPSQQSDRHPAEDQGSEDQALIEDEVQDFLNRVAREASALARRTDEPIEIVRSLIIGGAVLAAEFMKKPTRSDRQELGDLMKSLAIASGGLLEGSVTRQPRRIQIRRVKRGPAKRATRASTKLGGSDGNG